MNTFSVYTTTMNALFWQTTIEETLMSALDFADEVVVVDGGSIDGTIELIEDIVNRFGNVNLVVEPDKYSKLGQGSLADKKSLAASLCGSDYCMLLDADEVIHQDHMGKIMATASTYRSIEAFKFQTIHFYRSWDHYQEGPGWYKGKVYMFKNGLGVHHGKVGRDRDQIVDSGGDSLEVQAMDVPEVSIFHYGWCRNDAIMQMKKRRQEVEWWGKDYWIQEEMVIEGGAVYKKGLAHPFPLKFDNPAKLPKFSGTHPKYMLGTIEIEGNSRWIDEYQKDYEGYFK